VHGTLKHALLKEKSTETKIQSCAERKPHLCWDMLERVVGVISDLSCTWCNQFSSLWNSTGKHRVPAAGREIGMRKIFVKHFSMIGMPGTACQWKAIKRVFVAVALIALRRLQDYLLKLFRQYLLLI